MAKLIWQLASPKWDFDDATFDRSARVEAGAGERMIDRGLIHIYRLLGKLKDKPEQP